MDQQPVGPPPPPPQQPEQQYYAAIIPKEPPAKHPGRAQGIVGILCGLLSIIPLPPTAIVLGLMGIFLGVAAKKRGAKVSGVIAIVLSSILMVLSLIIFFWFFSRS